MFQQVASGQDDPGCEGNFTGRTCSPIQNVTSNSMTVQFNTYEPTVGCRVNFGVNPTCNNGSVTVENAGYPQTNTRGIPYYTHQFNVTGLAPSTDTYVQLSCTDPAGNVFTNSCAQQAFQGGGINATTLASSGITILTTSLPNGALNVAYSATLQASGGTGSYTWSESGALPPGLSLNTSTGVISGTDTTTAGTYPFTVSVTDGTHNAGPVPLSITITSLTITTSSLAGATYNVAYSQTLAASGGTSPYTWSHLLGVLPPGVSLAASTGVISGTPTACNTYPVTWKVTDNVGAIATRPLSIAVTGCTGTVTVTTPLPLHNCVVGIACPNQTETAAGGAAPYTWAVTSGALPTSMTLNSSTGILGGTPTATGTFNFAVTATDSGAIASAPSAQNITVISTSQLGVTLNGSVTVTGSTTIGTPSP